MKFPLLLDAYGVLLSERKRELLDYYYNEDYSLSEISELTGISRQGVRDSIKKSEEEILKLESKLNIVQKNEELSAVLADLEELLPHLDDSSALKIRGVSERLAGILKNAPSPRNETELE
ncbi:MAG: DNA-binding protein [Clostridia bacterium]|nr:DNA-binding protein [Clostridia bacterium]MBQ8370110.1 DNA-binding protein [Clostridia bacterium]MBQ8510993.1 DNA-binding protein [Clostridia bacterium]